MVLNVKGIELSERKNVKQGTTKPLSGASRNLIRTRKFLTRLVRETSAFLFACE